MPPCPELFPPGLQLSFPLENIRTFGFVLPNCASKDYIPDPKCHADTAPAKHARVTFRDTCRVNTRDLRKPPIPIKGEYASNLRQSDDAKLHDLACVIF